MSCDCGKNLETTKRCMQHGQLICCCLITVHDTFLDLTQVLTNKAMVPVEHISQRQRLEESILLHLVVEHCILTPIWRVVVQVTLVPDATVSDGNGRCLADKLARPTDKVTADLHHGNILEL